MTTFSAPQAFEYLVNQGFSPVHAATIAGNIQQESNFNPRALNAPEGAFGLMQWRLDRRQALEDFARTRGTPVTDPYLQLDFISQELRGPEARHANPFFSATDLPTANAALRRYIRYGDDTEPTRLANALRLMGQQAPQPMAPSPMPGAPPAGTLAPSLPLFSPPMQQTPGRSFFSMMPAPAAQPQEDFLPASQVAPRKPPDLSILRSFLRAPIAPGAIK